MMKVHKSTNGVLLSGPFCGALTTLDGLQSLDGNIRGLTVEGQHYVLTEERNRAGLLVLVWYHTFMNKRD